MSKLSSAVYHAELSMFMTIFVLFYYKKLTLTQYISSNLGQKHEKNNKVCQNRQNYVRLNTLNSAKTRVEVSSPFNANLFKICGECEKFLKISGECGKISSGGKRCEKNLSPGNGEIT